MKFMLGLKPGNDEKLDELYGAFKEARYRLVSHLQEMHLEPVATEEESPVSCN